MCIRDRYIITKVFKIKEKITNLYEFSPFTNDLHSIYAMDTNVIILYEKIKNIYNKKTIAF